VLKKVQEDRIGIRGCLGSWPEIIADLDSLTEVEQHGKRFIVRSAPRPAASTGRSCYRGRFAAKCGLGRLIALPANVGSRRGCLVNRTAKDGSNAVPQAIAPLLGAADDWPHRDRCRELRNVRSSPLVNRGFRTRNVGGDPLDWSQKVLPISRRAGAGSRELTPTRRLLFLNPLSGRDSEARSTSARPRATPRSAAPRPAYIARASDLRTCTTQIGAGLGAGDPDARSLSTGMTRPKRFALKFGQFRSSSMKIRTYRANVISACGIYAVAWTDMLRPGESKRRKRRANSKGSSVVRIFIQPQSSRD